MIKQHLHFRIPDNIDAPLWRYLDLRKFKSLLEERALYFRRADLFDDPLEGSYSDSAIADRPRFFEGAEEHFIKEGLPDMHQKWRLCTYVNCWHAATHESLAMWKLYDGIVAVQSSIDRLKNSIISDREFCLGPVNYIDYSRDYMSQANAFTPFFHKQKAYEHEKEFRILTFPGEDIGNVLKGTAVPGEGMLVKVDIDSLLESIVISPLGSKETAKKIKALIEKHQLLDRLKESSVRAEPKF